MHYGVLLISEERPTLSDDDPLIAQLLEPYKEQHWDWYQVGGRWTGSLSEYNPEDDPNNKDENGKIQWPTNWQKHEQDCIPIEQLTEEQIEKFYAFIVERYGWLGGETYYPWRTQDHFVKNERPPLEWLKKQGKFATIIDCHN